LQKCSIQPIAEHGVIGRGVLIDAARYKGKKHLDRDEASRSTICWRSEEAGRHDRKTRHHRVAYGMARSLLREGQKALFPEGQVFDEPGLQYSKELVQWWYEMEIPSIRRTRSDASRASTRKPAVWASSIPRCSAISA